MLTMTDRDSEPTRNGGASRIIIDMPTRIPEARLRATSTVSQDGSRDTTPTLENSNGIRFSSTTSIFHESKPIISRIQTQTLDPSQHANLSKNSLFFSDTGFSAPVTRHTRTKSGSSQKLGNSSSNVSVASLENASATYVADQNGGTKGESRWAGGFGSSLETPVCDLSSASSIRSRRNWDDFEGKPVSPLPSPAVNQHEQATSMFEVPVPPKKGSLDSNRVRIDTTSQASASEPVPETPSKTSAFFKTSWSVHPRAPSNKPAKHTRAASGSETSEAGQSSTWSTLSGSRAVSADMSQRRDPSSRSATTPVDAGTSATNTKTVPASSSLMGEGGAFPSHARIGSAESSMSNERPHSSFYVIDPNSSNRMFGLGSSSQTSLSAISDAPSATYDGLPPSSSAFAYTSPRSAWNKLSLRDDQGSSHSSPVSSQPSRADQRLWQEVDDSAESSARGYGASSCASRRHNSSHFHGPSENASGSSLAPAIATRHETKTFTVKEEETEEDEDGDQVGPYRIERTLGVGAFSRVALARLTRPAKENFKSDRKISSLSELRQRALGRTKSGEAQPTVNALVALKMLDREPCNQNERMKVSWVREVEVLRHISHPNLVRFVTSFSTPLHHTLVLEQVPGGELFDMLSNHHEEVAQREWLVRRIFSELANAIGWMHHVNLVHRDIKLENIIMTTPVFEQGIGPLTPSRLPKGPIVKLTDFGLSRFIDASNPSLETRCGSEEYAAPELIIGKKYDGRKTDAWALGVVLYALTTGSLPFLEELGGTGGFSGNREGNSGERDAKQRKTHLLRIAKGDLRWPEGINEEALDEPRCAPSLRLVTPTAKRMVARLIRRDSTKRATAWETWDEAWLLCGSFGTDTGGAPLEKSAAGEPISIHPDPRSQAGQAWLDEHASVKTEDVSQLACDD